jgi:hypothetical protein
MHRGDSIAAAMGVGDPRLTHRFERAMPQQIQSAMARRTVFRLGEPARPWPRVGSYPSRKAAISAAYGETQRQNRHRYTAPPRTGHPGGAPEAQDRYRGPDRGGPGRQTLPAVQPDSSWLHHRPHIRQRPGRCLAHAYLTEPHAHPRKGRSGNARNNAYPLEPSPGPSWATSS